MRRMTLPSVLLLLLLFPTLVAAQGPAPATVRIDRLEPTAWPEVQVLLTVRDPYGVPIPDLQAEHFALTEDETLQPAVRRVEAFTNPELGLAVVLVLDISGSMRGQPLADLKIAAARLLDALGPQDQVAVIAFADRVNLDDPFPQFDAGREHDLTADKAPLYALIEGLPAGGSTPLYDALYKAVRLAGRSPAGNRLVLVLTDGRDEDANQNPGQGSAVANEDTPIREANLRHIPIFTIGLGRLVDRAYLRRVAMETGGRFQETPDSSALAGLFENVIALAKQQYRLTYTSTLPADGGKHSLRVTVRVAGQAVFDQVEWTAPGQPGAPTEPATAIPTGSGTAATDTPLPGGEGAATAGAEPPPSAIPWPYIGGAAGLAGLVALLLGGRALYRRIRPPARPYRCLKCGRTLPGADAVCPHCGRAGTFQG